MLSSKKSKAVIQVEEYLHHIEFVKRFTYQSLRTKRILLTRFVKDTGVTDLRRLTNDQLEQWHIQLSSEGKVGRTINNYQQIVTSCLKYLSKRGHKLSIDFDLVETATVERRDQPWFTRDEIETIQAVCQGPRERLSISLLFDSAVRISEFQNLRVENISGTKIKVIQGKGRKDGTVFITEETKQLLDRWILLNDLGYGYIFPSPDRYGEPLSLGQIRAAITAPIRRAGFEKGGAHAVRRSKATDMRNKGADLIDVKDALRHENLSTTELYICRTEDQKHARYQQFA